MKPPEHVCPDTVAPNVAIQETAASKAGVHFCSADGGRMRNLGCQSWTAYTNAGNKTNIKVQVADRIHRTLFSVSRLTESGNKVVFDTAGSYIENKAIGHVTPLIHSDGTYNLVPSEFRNKKRNLETRNDGCKHDTKFIKNTTSFETRNEAYNTKRYLEPRHDV